MRWLIAALTALAGLTAALNEVASLDRFAADRLNFPPALPWTLPGMVTVGTVAGALMWTCLRQTTLRRAGRRLNITCAAVSALAVGLDHASGAVGWWAIPAGLIGGMVPALATWMTHLLARVTGEHQARPLRPARKAATTPAPDEVAPPDAPPPSGEGEPDELARARELVAKGRQDGGKYGRASLARDLGVTPHRARELLAQIDAVHLVVGA